MNTLTLACALFALSSGDESTPTLRLIDLDGDRRLDRLENDTSGALRLSLNRGRREFEPIVQSLPDVVVRDVLSADLNGDGQTDLYLVSPGANVALVGDGTGRFVDATLELGLADPAEGESAELIDIDGDGARDVLLHNTHGDVIFWGTETASFERDASTPVVTPAASLVPAPEPAAVPAPLSAPASSTSGDRDRDRAASSAGGTRRVVAPPAPGGSRTVGVTPPIIEPAVQLPYCANSIEDQSSGDCLLADSSPTLGRLYPLGQYFSIAPDGRVGINDTTPSTTLDVDGTFRARGSFSASTPVLENTGNSSIVLAQHTGALAPNWPFELREDSSSTLNSAFYPVLKLTRTNADTDGAGAGISFNLPITTGAEAEYASMHARAVSGLSSSVLRSGALDFYTTEVGFSERRMTIDSNGNVGIGTETPQAELEVVGGLRAAGTFNVTPAGDVGVGVALPDSDLHVANSLDAELRISPNTSFLNQGMPSLFLSEGLGINCGWRVAYDGVGTDNALKIISECTAPTTRMAFRRESGTVLVGGEDFSTAFAGSGLFRVNGDVSQALDSDGMVKAAVHVNGLTPTITRSFNNLPGGSTPSLTDLGVGIYEIDFGADITGRYYVATLGTGIAGNATDGVIDVTPRSGNPNALFVDCGDMSGVAQDNRFFVLVY